MHDSHGVKRSRRGYIPRQMITVAEVSTHGNLSLLVRLGGRDGLVLSCPLRCFELSLLSEEMSANGNTYVAWEATICTGEFCVACSGLECTTFLAQYVSLVCAPNRICGDGGGDDSVLGRVCRAAGEGDNAVQGRLPGRLPREDHAGVVEQAGRSHQIKGSRDYNSVSEEGNIDVLFVCALGVGRSITLGSCGVRAGRGGRLVIGLGISCTLKKLKGSGERTQNVANQRRCMQFPSRRHQV